MWTEQMKLHEPKKTSSGVMGLQFENKGYNGCV